MCRLCELNPVIYQCLMQVVTNVNPVRKQSKVEHIKYWQMPAYIERKAKYIAEYHKQEGAGVYAIYEKDEVIYIGESSQIQQRVTSHFSKHINKNHWQSPIPRTISKR
jgi:hypothetical protein